MLGNQLIQLTTLKCNYLVDEIETFDQVNNLIKIKQLKIKGKFCKMKNFYYKPMTNILTEKCQNSH